MAYGQRRSKLSNSAGKEWWGKRPLSNTCVNRNKGMKYWKRLLHKIERRIWKQEINNI